MKFTSDFDVRHFNWYGNAKDWYKRAKAMHMLDEVQHYIEKYFGNRTPEAMYVNDVLWCDHKLHEMIQNKEYDHAAMVSVKTYRK